MKWTIEPRRCFIHYLLNAFSLFKIHLHVAVVIPFLCHCAQENQLVKFTHVDCRGEKKKTVFCFVVCVFDLSLGFGLETDDIGGRKNVTKLSIVLIKFSRTHFIKLFLIAFVAACFFFFLLLILLPLIFNVNQKNRWLHSRIGWKVKLTLIKLPTFFFFAFKSTFR